MEKEKKVEKKEIKKIQKEETQTLFNENVKKVVKISSLVLSFFAIIMCIFTFVFGIITSLKVINSTKVELLHDNFSVTFLSNINSKSIVEMKDLVQGYGSKTLFIIVNVVLPALAIVAVSILSIILLKKIMDFVDDINTEKELFSKDNIPVIEKFTCLITTIITISFVVFNQPSFILYIFITLLLFIIINLFYRCVKVK